MMAVLRCRSAGCNERLEATRGRRDRSGARARHEATT
jgi:hypothetical protein